MSDFFASGRVADLILAVLVAEAAALAVYRRTTGRGPDLRRLAPVLVAGGFFALALRGALVGTGWPWIAAALVGAGAAHAAGLRSPGEHGSDGR